MAGKAIRLEEETRPLLDDVMDLIRHRGLDRLPLSVREGMRDVGSGRLTQAVTVHLGLLALHRHLTDVPELAERVPLEADPE